MPFLCRHAGKVGISGYTYTAISASEARVATRSSKSTVNGQARRGTPLATNAAD
jgi:hypothetical protein